MENDLIFGLPEENSPEPDKGSDVSRETRAQIRKEIGVAQTSVSLDVSARLQSFRSNKLPRPYQQRTVALINPRSQSGKTSSSYNLGAAFALQGLNILLIDLATQVDSASHTSKTLDDVLYGKAGIEEVLDVSSISENLSIARSVSPRTELELQYFPAKESRLQYALQEYEESGVWDYILLDTPSNFGILTINSVLAADTVLLPSSGNYCTEDVQSVERLLDFVERNFRTPVYKRLYFELQCFLADKDTQKEKSLGVAIQEWVQLHASIPWSRQIQGADMCVIDTESQVALAYFRLSEEINKII